MKILREGCSSPCFSEEISMTYEAPEIFELGDAEELTQAGCVGWTLDVADYPRIHCPVPPPEGGVD
jgi:hypothetical protein